MLNGTQQRPGIHSPRVHHQRQSQPLQAAHLQYVVCWQRAQQLHISHNGPVRRIVSWEPQEMLQLANATTGQLTSIALTPHSQKAGKAAALRHLRAIQIAHQQIAGTRVHLKTTGALPDDSIHGTLRGACCTSQAAAALALLRVAAGEASALLWTATDHDTAECWRSRLHADTGDQYGVALRGNVTCTPMLLRGRRRVAAASLHTGQLVHSAAISGGLGGMLLARIFMLLCAMYAACGVRRVLWACPALASTGCVKRGHVHSHAAASENRRAWRFVCAMVVQHSAARLTSYASGALGPLKKL